MRLATEADTAAVLAFTRRTWRGWDYLPEVWDSWLAARDGAVLVGEPADDGSALQGPIVVARVALLSQEEAWLEGLRVHPRARRRGLATVFQRAELEWARAQGVSVVRYATGEKNEASQRLGARHGFDPAGRWRALRPPARPNQREEANPGWRSRLLERLTAEGLVVSRGASVDERWGRLSGDWTFRAGQRLYEWRGWAWQELTRERLALHAGRGELLEASDGTRRALGFVAPERVPGELRLALVGGEVEPALRLVNGVAAAAGRAPSLRLPEGAPLLDDLAAALGADGWTVGDHALVLMARPLRDHAGRALPLPDDGLNRIEFAEPPRRLDLVPSD